VSAYAAFVLGYTWSHVAHSSLPGGRYGPLDAYRHTLASAAVAFTLSPRAVDLTTWFMERRDDDTNLMDRRNNQIGAAIGVHARSFSAIEPAVRAEVSRGAVNARDAIQLTPWRASRFW
jgi:hypothetical protein